MARAKKCIVAGSPIEHSLSPHLFSLVHEHLGIPWEETKKVLSTDINDVFLCDEEIQDSKVYRNIIEKVTEQIQGDNLLLEMNHNIKISIIEKEFDGNLLWGSITSPLKHQLEDNILNCFVLDELGLRTAMTDGFAVVLIAQHFGVDFELNPVLCLKGGGSTAIATANAWISLGGNIQAINGRRPLPDDILDKCSSELEPDLFIDFDNSSDSESLVLFPKYTSQLVSSNKKIDGRWMLVAQHLLSWVVLFAPEKKNDLPGIQLLFDRLVLLESMIELG